MNFKQWHERTKQLEKQGEETKNPGFYLAIMERCESLHDFLDESYEAILSQEEQDIVGQYMAKSLMKAMVLTLTERRGDLDD